MIYVITTGTRGFDLEIDQVCEDKAVAEREARDLRKMGCDNVKVRLFPTWDAVNAYEEKVRGY